MHNDVKLQFGNLASNSPYLGAYILELADWIREQPQLYKRLASRLDLLVNYVSDEDDGSIKSRIVNDTIYINLWITHKELGSRSRKTRDFAPARIQREVGNRLISELVRRNQALDSDNHKSDFGETCFVALQAFNESLDPLRSNWHRPLPTKRRSRQ